MPSAEGLIFQNENFGFGLMSKIWLRSYTGGYLGVGRHLGVDKQQVDDYNGSSARKFQTTLPIYMTRN